MKKNIVKTLLLALMVIGVSSCYDDDNWLDKNMDETGRSVPLIASFTSANKNFPPGATITLDLRFWSNDEIEQVDFFAQVKGNPQLDDLRVYSYEKAYSAQSRSDSLLIKYTVPNVPKGTDFGFQVVVRNVNGLTASSNEVRESPTGVPEGRDLGIIKFKVD